MRVEIIIHPSSDQLPVLLDGVELLISNPMNMSLAWLRGDGSLESQNVYIAQEIGEQTRVVLAKYHLSLLRKLSKTLQ